MNTKVNTTNNTKKKEFNLNKKDDFYAYLDDMALREVKEAVKYFKYRFRRTEDTPLDEKGNPLDEFVLMNKTQVELFKQLNTNPNVKIRIEYLDEQEKIIYGYILYREHPKSKYKKSKTIVNL